ncbi:MlaD family protein [Gordonia sp. (in: high G+C Gram-positive bacteria)]|uniref:MlaD family protein n=1 Tax=Gordonia sp. (in: high G+C Gram-positive bacteria) TaxID=84139 RepID=UPI0035272FE5
MRQRFPVGTVQFVLFLVISAIVIPFGIHYIAGPQGFGSRLRLYATMSDAFGLTKGTGVTVRGVDVGTVESARLSPDGKGARVEVSVNGDTKIPRDSYLMVTMASMAGIQSVDIVTGRDDGAYLRDGDTIAAPADRQPMQMDALMTRAAHLLGSFQTGTVATVGAELSAAFGGDDSLEKLVSNGAALAKVVRENAPMLRSLLGDWLDVLGAMDQTRASFETGVASMATFTDRLDAAQPVFVYLLDRSPAGLDRATALFDKYRGTFGGVLANLVAVEPVISDRSASLTTGLQTIPQGLFDLRSIVKNNRADFALVGTQGPVCLFYDEPRRAVGDLTPSQPNLTRYCPPGNGYGQRGAINAPRPNQLGTQNWTSAGGVAGPPAVTDPLLIPNGTELLQMWAQLLERARNGN